MSSYAHGQVGTIQEPYSAVLERALAHGRCVADLRGLSRSPDGHVDGVTAHRVALTPSRIGVRSRNGRCATSSKPSASAFDTLQRLGVCASSGEDAQLAPALAVHLGHTCFRCRRIPPQRARRVI